jgi:hypothetical protein
MRSAWIGSLVTAERIDHSEFNIQPFSISPSVYRTIRSPVGGIGGFDDAG